MNPTKAKLSGSSSESENDTKPNDGRKTFEKFSECRQECSKYKLKCIRNDSKWQCGLPTKKDSKAPSSGTKSIWDGKEFGACLKSCKASGKKCTRMKTDDASVRKFHCTDAVTTATPTTKAVTTATTKPSTTASTGKTWTKENYKTADPSCSEYCRGKDMRCSFVSLKPLTYGCKPKIVKTEWTGKGFRISTSARN